MIHFEENIDGEIATLIYWFTEGISYADLMALDHTHNKIWKQGLFNINNDADDDLDEFNVSTNSSDPEHIYTRTGYVK